METIAKRTHLERDAQEPPALERLITDGFVLRGTPQCVPAPRWRDAMARAASALQSTGADDANLRVPVAWALSAAYEKLNDDELAELIDVMLPMTAVALPT